MGIGLCTDGRNRTAIRGTDHVYHNPKEIGTFGTAERYCPLPSNTLGIPQREPLKDARIHGDTKNVKVRTLCENARLSILG